VDSDRPGQRARDILIAAILLAAGGWVSTASAYAGCSHLVKTTQHAAPFETTLLDHEAPLSGASESWHLSMPQRDPIRTPCSGFRCSESIPSAPLTPPQTSPRIDAFDRFDIAILTICDPASHISCDDDPPYALFRVKRLTRPPR
jgi:hypothetical protein